MLRYDFHIPPRHLRMFCQSFWAYFVTLWAIVVCAVVFPNFNVLRALGVATVTMLSAVLVVVTYEMVEYQRCWAHRVNRLWGQ